MKVPRRTATYRLHQWANDWISCDDVETGRPAIVSPRGIQLDAEERERMLATVNDPDKGSFWSTYYIDDDGVIRKKPR